MSLEERNYEPVLMMGGVVSGGGGGNLGIQTDYDNKTVTINTRNYTQTSGDSIALQSKANQSVTTTGTLWGGQIQPRLASGVGAANLIGLNVEPILKGGTGTISSDVQGIQTNFSDDGTAGRTISGDVAGIRAYVQLVATVSGDITVLKVEESGSNKWEYLAKLPNDASIASTTGTTATQAGYIKVKIGSTDKYIPLYNSQS